VKLDFENLASYTTEELEDAQRFLAQELRRRIKEKKDLEELEKLAAKYGYTLTKQLEET
jgi:hypothetical protein